MTFRSLFLSGSDEYLRTALELIINDFKNKLELKYWGQLLEDMLNNPKKY